MEEDKYIEKGKIERVSMIHIIPNLFKKVEYSYYFTPVEGKDVYDGYVMVFDKDSPGTIIGTYILEVKVRDRSYPQLMFEYKKWYDLKKKANETDAKIIYISVCPDGTYCFNIDKIINSDTKWLKEEHWKSTMDKSKGKVLKKLTYLDINLGKKLDYTTERCNKEYELTKRSLKTELKDHKNDFCLFRDVLALSDEEYNNRYKR